MEKLKIIQLAAYRGNLGDNANVVGTRRQLDRNLGVEIEYTDLEYLEYEPDPRWGGRKFDDDFVKLVNQHDLLLIGGGGFFQFGVDSSCSRTPLDISFDILEKIKVPIVFYALGFSTLYGVTRERIDKFKRYMDYLLSSENILVSFRNDGSFAAFEKLYGQEYASRIHKCPDGGFFTVIKDHRHIELAPNTFTIAIQLAGDGLKRRLPGDTENKVDQFLSALSNIVNDLFEQNDDVRVVLVPHIPADLNIIDNFITHLGPPYSRKRITVAPYVHGMKAHDYIFDLYSKCELVIGMRFHANVCNIGLNIPTIGLVTYEQIANLYQELGIPERAVRVDGPNFEYNLRCKILQTIADRDKIKKQNELIMAKLLTEITGFHKKIKELCLDVVRR